MSCPLDYSLCDRTVTLYRLKDGQVLRSVLEGCFFSRQEEEGQDLTGAWRKVKCYLIHPGPEVLLCPGDRVFEGVGPEIGPEEWRDFIPEKVQELAAINYIRPCYWQGQVCHTEAGWQ